MTGNSVETKTPRRWLFRIAVVCLLVAVFLAGWFVTGPRKTTPSPRPADAPRVARDFLARVSEGRLPQARQMLDPGWTDVALGTGLQSLQRDIAGKNLRKRPADVADRLALSVLTGMGYSVPSDLRIFAFSAGSTSSSVTVRPSGGQWRVWGFSYGNASWSARNAP